MMTVSDTSLAQIEDMIRRVEARGENHLKSLTITADRHELKSQVKDDCIVFDIVREWGESSQVFFSLDQFPNILSYCKDSEELLAAMYITSLIIEVLNNNSPINEYDRYQEKLYKLDSQIETPGLAIIEEPSGCSFEINLELFSGFSMNGEGIK